jgi:hypothetical protein
MLGALVLFHPLAVPGFMLFSGLLLCFWGRRLIPFAVGMCAFAVGFIHGGALISAVTESPSLQRWGPFAIALLAVVLAQFLYRLAVFAAGFLLGFFISASLFPENHVLLYLGAALLGGALVYLSRNFVFSVLTSVAGGVLAATGAVNLAAWLGVSAGTAVYWAVAAVLFAAGLAAQLKSERKRR